MAPGDDHVLPVVSGWYLAIQTSAPIASDEHDHRQDDEHDVARAPRAEPRDRAVTPLEPGGGAHVGGVALRRAEALDEICVRRELREVRL